MSVTMMGVTSRTAVPETSTEFIDNVVLYIEAIYQKVEQSLFAAIVRMLNVVFLRFVLEGRGTVTTKEVFAPS